MKIVLVAIQEGDAGKQLQQDYGIDKVLETNIRSNIALAKAQQAGIDIFSFNTSSNGAKDYRSLAQEFLSKTGKL